jgi:hypothetical protein
MEEGDRGEGEELVVCLHEEVGEHGPAGGGVEFLHNDISAMNYEVEVWTYAILFYSCSRQKGE